MKTKKAMDVNAKFCMNCGKDFNEKENFNWSCQVHRSEYGDHMWWCCGKRDINAPGCKRQKHSTREDKKEDGDDELLGDRMRQLKCTCCKDIGHLAEECPKDPNLRQAFDPEEEEDRVMKNMK